MSKEHLQLPERRSGGRPPTPEHPISGVGQIPLLQTPYIAALASSDTEKGRVSGDDYEGARQREGRRKPLEIPLPDGWKYYIHPKGWVYYFNPTTRLVTDYRMEYRLGQQEFEQALRQVEGYPVERLPPTCEIWVDYKLENGTQLAEKLFVDHAKRRLTPRAPPRRHGSIAGEESPWQDEDIDVWQQLLYEQAYWEYIIAHPCHAPLDKYAMDDAMASLAWYNQDRLLHPQESLVPYSTEKSKQLLELLLTMSEKEAFSGTRNGYIKTHLVASVLERVAGERLRRHYGQEDARSFLKRSLKKNTRTFSERRPWYLSIPLSLCMKMLCIGAPHAYLRQINDFFMSGMGRTDTITERWQAFVDDNVADWTNTNLVATVLVSASVALLAIPGIDESTRILGIVSTLFALSSIIAGLLNVWQNQHRSRANVELNTIFEFFIKADFLEVLAILLSLPLVLLIWATLVFAVSMVTFAWFGTDDSAFEFGKVTAGIATGFFGFLTIMVLNSVIYFWRAWSTKGERKDSIKAAIKRWRIKLYFKL